MLRKELLHFEAAKWIDGGSTCSGNNFSQQIAFT
jgi:hypothetical protein